MYVEIDERLSFEAFNFKRKEKLGGKKNPASYLKTQGVYTHTHTHTHTFAGNHTLSRVLSLKQRLSPPENGAAPSFSSPF